MPVISKSSGLVTPLRFDVDRVVDESGKIDQDSFAEIENELADDGQWDHLRDLYEFGILNALNGDDGRSLMMRAGLMCLEQLGDAVSAEQYFRRVLASHPEAYEALDAYAELCSAQERFEEAADYFDAAIQGAPDSEKVDLCIRLAKLSNDELGQVQRAIKALDFAFQIDPERVDILSHARSILGAEGRLAEAKAALDAELSILFGVELGDVPTIVNPSTEEEVEAASTLAVVYRSLGLELSKTAMELELARDCFEQARALGDKVSLAHLDDLRHQEMNHESVAVGLLEQADKALTTAEAAELCVQAAEVFLALGHDALRSEACIERALSLSPGHPAAVSFVDRAYSGSQHTEELKQRFERLLMGVQDVETEIQILARIAALGANAEDLDDNAAPNSVEEQIEAYQKVLALAPSHSESVEALIELWEEQGDYEKTIELLQDYLNAVSSSQAKVSAHVRMGQIYLECLGKVEEATEQLNSALVLDPGNFAAATTLRAIHLDANNHKELLDSLEILLEYAPDTQSRLVVLGEMQDVSAEVSASASFNTKRRLFEFDPNNDNLREELEQDARDNGALESWLDSLMTAAKYHRKAVSVPLWNRAGQILTHDFHRTSEAIAAFETALKLNPESELAQTELEKLRIERADLEQLVAALENSLESASDPAIQAGALDQLGAIYLDELEQSEKALEYFVRLRELGHEPTQGVALAKLQRLYLHSERWEELAEVLQSREEFTSQPDKKARLRLMRGQVLYSELNQKEAAAECLLDALPHLTDDEAELETLYQLARHQVKHIEIARRLEPIFARRAEFRRQVDMLRVLWESEEDSVLSSRWALRAGRILDNRLGEGAEALEVYAAALQARPESGSALRELCAVANRKGLQKHAVELLAGIVKADAETSDSTRSRLISAQAQMWSRIDEDEQSASDAFFEAVKFDATNHEAVHGMLREAIAQERLSQAVAQLSEIFDFNTLQDLEPSIALRVTRASIAAGREKEEAQRALEELLERFPSSAAIVDEMVSLNSDSDEETNLALFRACDEKPLFVEVKASLEIRHAHLELRRSKHDRALILFQQALNHWPESKGARKGLRELLKHSDSRTEAGALLESAYEADGDAQGLIDALKAQLEAIEDNDERLTIYRRIADLQTKRMASSAEAFRTMSRAFSEGVLEEEQAFELVLLALKGNVVTELETLFQEKNTPALQRELARLYESFAWNSEKALSHWNAILETNPGDAEASSVLGRLNELDLSPSSVAQMLENRGETTDELDEAILLYSRAAYIFAHEAGQVDKGLAVNQKARELAPHDWSALSQHVSLLQLAGRTDEAEGLLESEISSDISAPARAELYAALGNLQLGQQEFEAAVRSFGRALQVNNSHPEALNAINGLLETSAESVAAAVLENRVRTAGDWKALIDIYERVVLTSKSDARKVEHLNALRCIYETKEIDLPKAFDAASRAFRIDPEDDHVATAVARLASITGAANEWMSLLNERAEGLPEEDPQRLALRKRVAEFFENELNESRKSLDAWLVVLDEWPEDIDALDAITRIGGELGDEKAVTRAFETLARLHEDSATKVEYLRAAASITEGLEDERDHAIELYQQVLSFVEDDNHALKQLDRLLEAEERYEDLKSILQRRISNCHNAYDDAVLKGRLGRLCIEHLGALQEGFDCLTALVDLRGIDGLEEPVADAANTLNALMEVSVDEKLNLAANVASVVENYWFDAKEFNKTIRCKRIRAQASADEEAIAELHSQIADIYETGLSDTASAFEVLAELIPQRVEDGAWIESLERLSTASDKDEAFIALLEDALVSDFEVSDESRLALCLRMARVLEDNLGRAESAGIHLEQARRLSKGDSDILNALERVYTKTQDFAGQVSVFREMLEADELDDVQRQELWARVTGLLEEEIGDGAEALKAYAVRIELAPDARDVIESMVALAEKEADGHFLTDGLTRLVDLSEEEEEQKSLLFRLGVAALELSEDRMQSVEAFAQILSMDDEHSDTVTYLERIFEGNDDARLKSARALAPYYQKEGQHEKYLEVLNALLDGEILREERRDILVEIAEAYVSTLPDSARAFEYSCRAFEVDAAAGNVRALVEQIAVDSGMYQQLVDFYKGQVDELEELELAQSIRHRMADIYELELEENEAAIEVHMKIIEYSPSDAESLESLERLYKDLGSFTELAEVYEHRVSQADNDSARVALMRELARIRSDLLGETQLAIETLGELLALEPYDLPGLKRLALLHEKLDDFEKVEAVLLRLIAAAEDSQDDLLYGRLELTRVYLDRLNRVDDALSLVEKNVVLHPTDLATRRFLRTRIDDALEEERQAFGLRFAELNTVAMRAGPEARELIEAIRIEIGLREEPQLRAALNREVADVYIEQLNEPELGFAALSQAVSDEPTSSETLDRLEHQATELELLDDVLDVYEGVLLEQTEEALVYDLRVRMARLLHERLGDLAAAMDAWQTVLDLRPTDDQAASALDDLYVSQQRWDRLADVLVRRVEIAEEDVELKYELLSRLGALYEEQLENAGKAIEWYEKAWRCGQAWQQDSQTLVSARALEQLLTEEGHPELMAEVLASLVWREDVGVSEKLDWLLALARICTTIPGRRPDAIEYLESALDIDSRNSEAVSGLEKLYELEERWEEFAKLLNREIEASSDMEEILELKRRLAFVAGTRLGTPEEAIGLWTDVLRRDPNDYDALQALRKTYRVAERWEALVENVKKMIALQTEAQGVKELRFELADVYLHELQQREDGINEAKRVLDIQPLTVAELIRLEELFEDAEAYTEAIRVMNYRVDSTEDRGEKVDVLFAIAQVYSDKLNRVTNATSTLERILEEEPQNSKAYEQLSELYEQNSDYRRLIDLVDRKIEVCEDVELRTKLVLDKINIQEEKLGLKELAFASACGAFSEDPNNLETQALAERLAEETSEWDTLADVFEEELEQVALPRAMEIRRRLAYIHAHKLNDVDEAEDHLEVVISMRPEDEDAWVELADIFGKQERWDDVIALRKRHVGSTSNDEIAIDELVSIAKVQSEQLSQRDEAVSSLREALSIVESASELTAGTAIVVLDALAKELSESEQWRALIEVQERKLRVIEDEVESASVRYEIARTWDECIDDVERAIVEYRAALDSNPAEVRALKALEHLYAETEQFGDLVDIYEQQALLSVNSENTVEMWLRIASLKQEKMQDLEGASNALIKALEADPSHLVTVKRLEEVWRLSEDYGSLVEALERHLNIIGDEHEESTEVYLALGDVCQKLGRTEQAESSLRTVLEREPENISAIHYLANLFEENSDWDNALGYLAKEAELVVDPKEGAVALFRMGNIYEHMQGDRDSATEHYEQATQRFSGETRAVQALAEIRREEEDWKAVAQLEEMEAAHLPEAEAQAAAYYQAAKTTLEYLDLLDEGIRLFELSVAAYSDYEPSIRALADLYSMNQDWEPAENYLEILVQRLEAAEQSDELGRFYFRLAYISEKLSDEDLALERYLASQKYEPNNLDTLEGLANALKRAERWSDAEEIFQSILVHHRDTYTNAEIVYLYSQLGDIAVEMEKYGEAKRHFDSALDLEESDVATLRSYALLCEKTEEWERAYDLRSRLIPNLFDQDRFGELLAQAKLCEEYLKDAYRATDALTAARKIQPDHRLVLQTLVRLYQSVGQSAQAIAAARDLLAVSTEDTEKFDLYCLLAELFDKGQKDWKKSALAYNKALDIKSAALDVFAKQEQMLARHKRWPELAYAYQLMIQRLGNAKESAIKRAALWRALGDLYREVINDKKSAAQAYDCVLKLQPDAYDVAFTLAKMLQNSKSTVERSLDIFHDLVGKVDTPDQPVRELFGTYGSLKRYDRCAGAAASLVLMKSADNEEIQAYEKFLELTPEMPTGALTDQLWLNFMFHPSCRSPVADLLRVLYDALPGIFGDAQSKLELKKKERVDLGSKQSRKLRYFKIWKDVASALNVGKIEHYHREGTATAPRLYPGRETILVTGKQNMVFREMPAGEIMWILAREMTFARREFAPVRALAPYEIALLLEATVRVVSGKASGSGQGLEPRAVLENQKWLEGNLDGRIQSVLAGPVEECLRQGALQSLGAFLHGVEHTASRVAVMLSRDIRSVARGLSYTDPVVPDMKSRRRMREIMLFLMSDDFYTLGEQLRLKPMVASGNQSEARV